MRKLIAVIITLLIASPSFGQGWSSSIGGDVTLAGVAALYPRGTDGRPSIGVQSDTDTGIRFPADGQISFILNGNRKVLFDASGFLLTTNYLNFGTQEGTSGYGFRNNGGVLQFKDEGGSWINVAAASNGAPTTATYILQTSNGGLSAEQALANLSTGLVQVTTGTGVLTSITDSAGLAALISDTTGTGSLVFGTSPTLTTPTLAGSISGTPSVSGAWTFAAGSVGIRDTDNTHNLVITPGSNLSANRILRLTTGDAERTITIGGDATLNNWFDQDVRTSSSPSFTGLSITSNVLSDLKFTDATYDIGKSGATRPRNVFASGTVTATAFVGDGSGITGTLGTMPLGAIIPYGGTAAPVKWLLCDGSAVSRTTYAAVFAVTGTAFGVGNGTTTFNLPDLRQRFALGKAGSGTGATLGGTGGAIDHTHTSAAHTHTFTTGIESTSQTVQSGSGAGTAANNHTHTGTTDSTTPGATGANNPPFQVVNYIIYTGV